MPRLLHTAPYFFALPLLAQQPPSAPSQAAPPRTPAAQTQQAEDLLEHDDYRAAEPLLAQLATANPKDAHLLFDLGLTQEHNHEEAAAAVSYTAAV